MYDFETIDFETANQDMYSACSVGIITVDLVIVNKDEYIKLPES